MSRILLLLSLLLPTTLGVCPVTDSILGYANVTHNYSMPGFKANLNGQSVVSNDTSDQWTITAAVYRNATTLETKLRNYVSVPAAQLQQYDFRNNSANATQWNPSPFVCAQVMDYQLSTLLLSSSPDGRCTSVASSKCLADVQQQYLDAAQAFHGPKSPLTLCQEYANTVLQTKKWPSSCASLAKHQAPLGSYASANFNLTNHDASCPFGLVAIVGDPVPTSPDNYTIYDRAVNGITTWIYVRFGNASREDTGVDVQIMCPSAGGPGNVTSPNSRDVVIVDSAGTRQRATLLAIGLTLVGAVVML